LLQFSQVRDQLAAWLAPFAIATTAPDPAMPWAALDGSGWWELRKPDDLRGVVTDRDVKKLNLVGGLSREVHLRASSDDAFVAAAVEVIAGLIGPEPALTKFLDDVGLPQFINGGTRPTTEKSPEVADAIDAVESVINPRRRFGGQRLTAAENKVIEERAVLVTRQHFEKLGYTTKDVGATHSYDVHATKGAEAVKVEVKGTTTNGATVALTRKEVELHRVQHPHNALSVVRKIVLDHRADEPVATGGELVLVMPWKIDEAGLSAIAYDYATGI
jgi:hypothetical protein